VTLTGPHDPATALAGFAARVGDFDPATRSGSPPSLADRAELAEQPVTVELRHAGRVTRVSLSPYVARAFAEALHAYHDPNDRGSCDRCGGHRLDDNFYCLGCGHVNGVLGATLAAYADRMRPWESGGGDELGSR
jgi:hypothetical protein